MNKSIIPMLACLCVFLSVAIGASATPIFQVRLASESPVDDSEPMSYVTHNQNRAYTNVLYVQKAILLDQTALKSVKQGTDGLGQPILEIAFTDDGAKRFAEVTRQNVHKRLAIIINDQLCEAPVVQMEISGGKAQISGSFSKEEVEDLVKKINESLTK